MQRTTIDYGIDLGTTKSAIAVLKGTEPVVIPNDEGASFTPSVVWIHKKGGLRVGRLAKERTEEDPDNCVMEFKRSMGQRGKAGKTFANTGHHMLPEELSAEMLKSLKADVQTNTGEELRAAVITVPAAFELPQCEATRKAAELAGLSPSPLLQEPVAAALAYGFQQESEKEFWLVYDYGGGTFDAAVVQVRDGVIQVINHAGDNHLGGKDIDWDIVEKCLIPAMTRQFGLSDLRRGNDKWRATIGRLKLAAERAKIEVCRKKNSAVISLDSLRDDSGARPVDFEYELTPTDLEQIVAPYINRSVNLCKKALEEKGLAGRDIAKILMVGGASLIPWVRDRVTKELGAPLEFSIDPITVVARGAAVFAGTQPLAVATGVSLSPDAFRVDLEHERVGSSADVPVGGRVHHAKGGSLEGYTIEIVEAKTRWSSGKIKLGEEGTFLADVHAEKGRQCEFLLELCDSKGTRQQTSPDRFHYTIGLVITSAPLTHSVGVATADNRLDTFIEKGSPLPARANSPHHTAYPIRVGRPQDRIRIPVVEGENNKRADRNRLIGAIEIPNEKIKRDLPAGSDVEITICIDESRLITTKAYIQRLDEEFEGVIKLEKTPQSVDELRAILTPEMSRLKEVREKANATGDPKAKETLAKIEGEDMLGQVESSLAAGAADPDALQQCENRLLDLQAAIDKVQDALEWPSLVAEAQANLQETTRVVNQHGEADEKSRLHTLETDLAEFIKAGDPDFLRKQSEEIRSLGMKVLVRQPSFWIEFLQYIETQRSHMRDRELAEQLFVQAQRAIKANDLESLQAAVRQLLTLLPSEEQAQARTRGFGGTTLGWT